MKFTPNKSNAIRDSEKTLYHTHCEPYKHYEHSESRKPAIQTEKKNNKRGWRFILLIVPVAFAIILLFILKKETSISVSDLKAKYPTQKMESWPHILSVLDTKFPTVKSITLLHGDDQNTSNCLAKHLVTIFSKDKSIQMKDIMFKNIQAEDYGEVLEHYRPIIRKYRTFITDLNKVPANLARIFHSLCDEVSSDIKPSLFIFTLYHKKNSGKLKPIEIVTSALKEAWSNLPESDIEPLLSRVVKNVIHVVPEKKLEC